jgi:two-component system chemotaxis response regulator CheB
MPASRTVRILLADDSAAVRLSMRRLLEAEPDFVVVAAVENGLRAVEEALRLRPDVLILDIEMPVMGGARGHGQTDRRPLGNGGDRLVHSDAAQC